MSHESSIWKVWPSKRKGEMFLEVHKIATRVLGRPLVIVTECGVNTLFRFIHMISLANEKIAGTRNECSVD